MTTFTSSISTVAEVMSFTTTTPSSPTSGSTGISISTAGTEGDTTGSTMASSSLASSVFSSSSSLRVVSATTHPPWPVAQALTSPSYRICSSAGARNEPSERTHRTMTTPTTRSKRRYDEPPPRKPMCSLNVTSKASHTINRTITLGSFDPKNNHEHDNT